MKYKVRDGVVRAKICGAYLLIPSREASEFCPLMRVGLITYTLIGCVERTGDYEEMYNVYRILGRTSEEEARKKADEMVENLCGKGILIPLEEEP